MGRVTLGEVMVVWLEENSHLKSLETTKLRLTWLRKHLGDDVALGDIKPDVVAKLKAKDRWNGQPVKKSTVNRTLSALSGLFTLAHEKKWVESVPHFPWASEKGNRRTQRLSRDDVVRLIGELPMHLALMLSFSLLTGVRENNILGLKWGQVDREAGVIRYEEHDMKGGRIHIVPITPDLGALLDLCGNDPYVFTYNGKPITRVSNHGWYKALKRAGLEGVTFHEATRHTWASWHAMSGTPLQVLKELGGWKDTRSVERYTHLAPEFLAKYASNAKMR
jgi:integrase